MNIKEAIEAVKSGASAVAVVDRLVEGASAGEIASKLLKKGRGSVVLPDNVESIVTEIEALYGITFKRFGRYRDGGGGVGVYKGGIHIRVSARGRDEAANFIIHARDASDDIDVSLPKAKEALKIARKYWKEDPLAIGKGAEGEDYIADIGFIKQ